MHLERIWNAYEKNKKGKLRPAHRGFAAGIAIDIARKDCGADALRGTTGSRPSEGI